MKASPHDDFAICAMPRRMRVVWTQHHIRQCIIEMFPEGWLNNVAIPCLEDLVNQSPFVDCQFLRRARHSARPARAAPLGWRPPWGGKRVR